MARRGFTLIELMLAVVIVGLLATVALPQLSNARERTYTSVLKSDLRNFVAAEESYFYDFSVYTSDPASVVPRGFEGSDDVSLVVHEATASGWSATASHTRTTVQCFIFLGSAAPVGSASAEGVISCG
ncbi:MAG: prepilin-type N-terminal cleavage/methylation domain-containing protein [Gemmatimonadetes bacterium]|nr:prepilin-type N-terminal cleavage/methylation domain-containing protein [Gemmatimonadota bacterium]